MECASGNHNIQIYLHFPASFCVGIAAGGFLSLTFHPLHPTEPFVGFGEVFPAGSVVLLVPMSPSRRLPELSGWLGVGRSAGKSFQGVYSGACCAGLKTFLWV